MEATFGAVLTNNDQRKLHYWLTVPNFAYIYMYMFTIHPQKMKGECKQFGTHIHAHKFPLKKYLGYFFCYLHTRIFNQ